MEDRCEGTPVHHATLTVRDDAACRRIHGLTTELLTDIGVDMKHEPTRELCAPSGASVDGRRVRFPAALIERVLATVPRSWAARPTASPASPCPRRL